MSYLNRVTPAGNPGHNPAYIPMSSRRTYYVKKRGWLHYEVWYYYTDAYTGNGVVDRASGASEWLAVNGRFYNWKNAMRYACDIQHAYRQGQWSVEVSEFLLTG